MFSVVARYQSAVKAAAPFQAFRRSFISSAFVKNNNGNSEDGTEKTSDSKHDNEKAEEEKVEGEKVKEDKVERKDTKTNIEDELKDMTQKFKQLQSQYLLSLADQENLRQRTAREVKNAKEYSIQKFAKDLLDSVDILNIALKSVPGDVHEKSSCLKKEKEEIVDQLVNLYTGVSMTETELLKTLKRYDIVVDDPIDQEFDPNKHEAVFQAPVPEKKPGTIFVVQKVGYVMKDRILRAAQVGVVAEAQSNE